MAQRFYRQNIAQYNPLSFEEMLFAPSMMRQKHDALDAALMDTQTSLGQYNALSQDQDFVQQAIDPVSQELNTMAEQLSKEGFNQQSMTGFRKLKTQRDKLFSPTGEVGIAQSRLASFQEKAKELKEQYKKNPEIANFYINELAKSEGLQRDVDGNIINQGLNSINNVRHYDAKEINDMLNTQVDNIKPVLMRELGLSRQQLQGLSSVQDLFMAFEEYGVDMDRATKVLLSQTSPEVIASAQQYGKIHMGSPEAGIEALTNQIRGAAAGVSGIHRKDYDRKIITNEDKKFDRDQKMEKAYKGLYTDSGRLELPTENPFKGIDFKDGEFNIETPLPSGTKVQGVDPLAPGAQRVSNSALTENYNTKQKEAGKKLKELKDRNPVLSNMTDEQVFKTINNYYENISQNYMGKANFDKNLDIINQTLKGNLINSTFMTSNGEVLGFSDLAELTGLTEEEVIKNYKGTTGVEINPILGASAPVTLTDKKGKAIEVYQQLDKESQSIVEETQNILKHLYSNASSTELSSEVLGRGEDGIPQYLNTYILNDFINEPIVVKTTANLSPKDLKELTGKSLQELEKELPKSIVSGVKSVIGQTSKNLASNIQNSKY